MNTKRLFIICFSLLSVKVSGQTPLNVSYYLNNREISKTAKDFYNNKFSESDDKKTLSIIDSLKTRNSLTRPFYIYLVSRMMRKSDGALSEVLGIACKNFIESHPDYAFDFLFSASRMTNQGFIDSWAESVAGEFQIDCEGKEKNA